ncbi:hypothetical protein PR001_g22338 [Phytophthora rubi]|uniref:Uncharacterized protein n=1 Tax=Phytophthora rubi TaxID=129364 RepID=A0A6A3IWC4_9STRA|nr:hypothetical protein PR001_g22338 [Phytophthora rubi]
MWCASPPSCPCWRRPQLHQRHPSVSLACSCVTARTTASGRHTSVALAGVGSSFTRDSLLYRSLARA